jgi:hypothetical protein
VGEERGKLVNITYLVGCPVRKDTSEVRDLRLVKMEKPA